MGGSSTYLLYNSSLDGLTYSRYPPSGILAPGEYNFTFAAYHTKGLLENCSMAFLNDSRGVINITYGLINGTTCNLSFRDFPFTNSMFGKYSVNINGSWIVLEGDAHWINVSINTTGLGLSIFSFINDSISLQEWGDNPETNDFSRIAFFFLILAIIIGALNYYSNYDALYPGSSIYIITAAIFAGSVVNSHGFFYMNATSLGDFGNNWILFLLSFMIMVSVTMMNIRRNEGG
jgi:hypothetical protein